MKNLCLLLFLAFLVGCSLEKQEEKPKKVQETPKKTSKKAMKPWRALTKKELEERKKKLVENAKRRRAEVASEKADKERRRKSEEIDRKMREEFARQQEAEKRLENQRIAKESKQRSTNSSEYLEKHFGKKHGGRLSLKQFKDAGELDFQLMSVEVYVKSDKVLDSVSVAAFCEDIGIPSMAKEAERYFLDPEDRKPIDVVRKTAINYLIADSNYDDTRRAMEFAKAANSPDLPRLQREVQSRYNSLQKQKEEYLDRLERFMKIRLLLRSKNIIKSVSVEEISRIGFKDQFNNRDIVIWKNEIEKVWGNLN